MVLFSSGRSLFLTIAVSIAMEWSTKLTLSWTRSTMRTSVRQQRLQSAGFYQAKETEMQIIPFIIDRKFTDTDKAAVESEFYYKECCNDETGIFPNIYDNIF